MKKIIKFIVVVFSVNCLLALMALGGDGKGGPPKKKKPARVQRIVKQSRVIPAPREPVIELRRNDSKSQLIWNIYSKALLTTNWLQNVDWKHDGSNNVPIVNELSPPRLSSSPEVTARDKSFAERFIRDFKTTNALFITSPANSSSVQIGTIMLEKESWSDDDIRKVQELIAELFAPVKVSYVGGYVKTLLIPGQSLAQVEP